jgi:hypothetical protein
MADDNGSLSAVESLLGDRYTREARLAPAFLSVFPILLVLIISFKGLQSAIPALLSLLCVFGVVRWISHIARGIGDKKEVKLFRDWGGKPTTTLMRVALGYMKIEDTKYGDHVRHLLWEAPPGDRIQEVIKKRNGQPPPSVDEDKQASDPSAKKAAPHADKDAAGNPPAPINVKVAAKKGNAPLFTISDALDRLYEPAVAWMRENSRNCVLVVEEEISYGFQRNFYALWWFALFCTVASILVEARAAHLSVHLTWPFIHVDSDMAAVILIALAAYLLFLRIFVTEKSVMVQGFIYARALLDSFYAEDPSTKPLAKPALAKDAS